MRSPATVLKCAHSTGVNHGRGFFAIVPTGGTRGRSVSMFWSMAYFSSLRIKHVSLCRVIVLTCRCRRHAKNSLNVSVLTVGGLSSLLAGSMILTDSAAPELQVSLPLVLPIVFGVAAIAVLLGRMSAAAQRRRPVTGAAAMIGQAGRALTAIEPGGTGRVTTHGEIWKAVATEPIAEGDSVAVTHVDGLTLTVRKS